MNKIIKVTLITSIFSTQLSLNAFSMDSDQDQSIPTKQQIKTEQKENKISLRTQTQKFKEALENVKSCGRFSDILGNMLEFYKKEDAEKYKKLISAAEEEHKLQKKNPQWKPQNLKSSIKGSAAKDKILKILEEIK